MLKPALYALTCGTALLVAGLVFGTPPDSYARIWGILGETAVAIGSLIAIANMAPRE